MFSYLADVTPALFLRPVPEGLLFSYRGRRGSGGAKDVAKGTILVSWFFVGKQVQRKRKVRRVKQDGGTPDSRTRIGGTGGQPRGEYINSEIAKEVHANLLIDWSWRPFQHQQGNRHAVHMFVCFHQRCRTYQELLAWQCCLVDLVLTFLMSVGTSQTRSGLFPPLPFLKVVLPLTAGSMTDRWRIQQASVLTTEFWTHAITP